MGRINLLDSSVYNVIAAGEVVERPASIVKELVENSIDAGATAITVEIRNGGIDLIRVTDNGGGMEPDDVPKAFLAHATSKIKTADDLDGIGTLGFRGEALASIAAVSDVVLVSRTPTAEMGYGIALEGGKIMDRGERGCPIGTSVTVTDVFGRIPARRKFLSKPHTEEAEISNLITRFILANYNISFKYTADGKNVLFSSGQGIEQAVYTVYGKEFSENISPISYTLSDIILKGYVCKPYYTKHNRNFQTLIVNGRYVINGDISYQVYDCYQNFLMKRQYPAYVLYLDLPLDMVDVNVHPNKLDVKFAAPQLIKRIVRDAVKSVLGNTAREVKDIPSDSALQRTQSADTTVFQTLQPVDESAEQTIARPSGESRELQSENFTPQVSVIVDRNAGHYGGDELRPLFEGRPKPFLRESAAGFAPGFIDSRPADFGGIYSDCDAEGRNAPETGVAATAVSDRQCESMSREPARQKTEQIAASLDRPMYTVRGVLFDTYIVVEQEDVLFLLDQHAAHEKLLYDKLTAQVNAGKLAEQMLLVPYDFDVSFTDGAALADSIPLFKSHGFTIEKVSDTAFRLCGVPAVCSGMNIRDFLFDLLQNETLGRAELLKESLMQAACKAAVKGYERLSEDELDALLDAVIRENVTLYCPHGRPIAVRITKKELEKWFKRVV